MRVDVAPPDAKIWLDRYLTLLGRSFGRYVCENTNLHVRVLLAHVAGETVGKLQHKPCVASVLVSALDAVVFRDDLPALRAEADEVGVVHLREVVDERRVVGELRAVRGYEAQEGLKDNAVGVGIRVAKLALGVSDKAPLAVGPHGVVFGMLAPVLLWRQVVERRVAVLRLPRDAVAALYLVRARFARQRAPVPLPELHHVRELPAVEPRGVYLAVVERRLCRPFADRDLRLGVGPEIVRPVVRKEDSVAEALLRELPRGRRHRVAGAPEEKRPAGRAFDAPVAKPQPFRGHAGLRRRGAVAEVDECSLRGLLPLRIYGGGPARHVGNHRHEVFRGLLDVEQPARLLHLALHDCGVLQGKCRFLPRTRAKRDSRGHRRDDYCFLH